MLKFVYRLTIVSELPQYYEKPPLPQGGSDYEKVSRVILGATAPSDTVHSCCRAIAVEISSSRRGSICWKDVCRACVGSHRTIPRTSVTRVAIEPPIDCDIVFFQPSVERRPRNREASPVPDTVDHNSSSNRGEYVPLSPRGQRRNTSAIDVHRKKRGFAKVFLTNRTAPVNFARALRFTTAIRQESFSSRRCRRLGSRFPAFS